MGFDLLFSTMDQLTPLLRAGDLYTCEVEASKVLQSLPDSPFHIITSLAITNDPKKTAGHFDKFFQSESARFDVKAVYTEMNGFSINPECWYCDLFAYEKDGGLDDFDWLSYWQSDFFRGISIIGLEPLQSVYASDAFHDEQFNDAASLAGLVVIAKFQRFIQQATSLMSALKAPLYVTAHDYDYIARLDFV